MEHDEIEESGIVSCNICERVMNASEHLISIEFVIDEETIYELKICELCEERCYIVRTVTHVDDDEIVEQNATALIDLGEPEEEEEEEYEEEEEEYEEEEEDTDEIASDENEFE